MPYSNQPDQVSRAMEIVSGDIDSVVLDRFPELADATKLAYLRPIDPLSVDRRGRSRIRK
jgi:hypothetical protein